MRSLAIPFLMCIGLLLLAACGPAPHCHGHTNPNVYANANGLANLDANRDTYTNLGPIANRDAHSYSIFHFHTDTNKNTDSNIDTPADPHPRAVLSLGNGL